MKMNGSEILCNCLLEQGADTVFGFPGGSVLNIYDALYKYKDQIRHILTCHEQAAAHAADGFARSTGKVGVVIATSGPGATNLVTGLATAYMDSVPIVAITGNVSLSLLGKDSFQEVDITGITMPITKHNFIVKDVRDLADTVRRAFKIAKSGRQGPVLIDIPKDITAAICEYTRIEPEKIIAKTTNLDHESIDEAVKLIHESKKPFIFAGGGVISSGASEELKTFSKLINAPVALSLMGIGSIPSDDEYYTGMLGMHGTKVSSLAVSSCDLLIAVGSRFSDRVLCDPNTFAKNAKILHIDIDPAEINKNVDVSFSIISDIKEALSSLISNIVKDDRKEWIEQLQEWKQKYPIFRPRNDISIAQHILEAIGEMTDGNTIVSTEVGQHQMWTAQYYRFKKPRTYISSGGLGTMGFGLGAAIGAQIANPDKRVVNIAGDGSFYMNLAELATLVTYNLPVIEVIMNNGVLGMVRQWQKIFYDKRFSNTTLDRKTDLIMLANAFGMKGLRIETEMDIEPVLKEALSANAPCLIDCRIGCDLNVIPMVPAGGPIDKPIFDID